LEAKNDDAKPGKCDALEMIRATAGVEIVRCAPRNAGAPEADGMAPGAKKLPDLKTL